MARHLLYHVMPIAANDIWRWNVKELKRRLPLFDGQRTCAIVTQPTKKPYTGTARPPDFLRCPLVTVPAEEVVAELKPHGFKFIVMKNDPNLREVKTLYPLMKTVKPYVRHDDVTLYAQAKAVTRFWQHPGVLWTKLLYESMMDYYPAVEKIMTRAPVAGSFLKWGNGWIEAETSSQWHYSGSWFWFHNASLFSKPDWWRVNRFWSGIECYPSLHFGKSEAGCVFHEGTADGMQLYDPTYLANVVKEFEEWKSVNTQNRTDIGLSAGWCPTI